MRLRTKKQLSEIMHYITTEHVLIYSLIYFIILLICRFFPILFPALICLQLISVSVDLYLFFKLRK